MTFTLDGALAAGRYEIKWTTVAEDTDVARGTIAFSVAPAPPTASTDGRPDRRPRHGRQRRRLRRPPSDGPASAAPSPTPGATPPVDADTTGSGGDVVLPISHRPDRRRSGAAVSPQPSEPPVDVQMTLTWRARLGAAVTAAIGLGLTVPAGVAAHTLNATYESRLPLAVYLVGAATTVALSFAFVITRDVRAAPPGRRRPRDPARRPSSGEASRQSAWSAGPGSSPRGSPAGRATATSRRSSCGSTAGSAWRSCPPSSGRSGISSTRSRRSTTWAPRCCGGSGSAGGTRRDYPERRSGAGRRRSGSQASSGSSSSRSPAPRPCSSCSSGTRPSPSR